MGWGSVIAVREGVGRRHGSDPMCLLAATVLTRPLAWEPPCATGSVLKTKDKKKKKADSDARIPGFEPRSAHN